MIIEEYKTSLQRKEQVSKAIFSPSLSIFSLEIIEPPCLFKNRIRFFNC